MPRVKPENRKRAKRPKTKTGCSTCKVRRVKCDEAWPSCQRCVSTGRVCDGYGLRSDNCTITTLSRPSNSPPSIFRTSKESRSFHYYLERTSHQVSGVYQCEFWNRIVLQAAHVDPAIRYAIIALGSLHEKYEKTGGAEKYDDDFALQQYNLAITQHLQHLTGEAHDPDNMNSYIASCMIFMCIELIQGHYLSAVALIKGAVKLFYQQCMERDSAWPVEIFEAILSRLQSQAVALLSPSAVGHTVPPRLKAISDFQIPEQFHSVAEARQCLEFYNQSHILDSSALRLPHKREVISSSVYVDMLAQWTAALDKMLVAEAERLTSEDWRAAKIVAIWRMLIEGNLALRVKCPSAYDYQELYDEYMERFQEVVRLAEEVLEGVEDGHADPAAVAHRFTLDLGLVGPLYDVARICRHPVIRRKAIHLLRAYPCREGLWDSLLAATTAERQMELEEAAVAKVDTAADVPGWARIATAMPTFHFGERWASVVYTRRQPLDGGQPVTFDEILRW